jgi:hypothetical protein
LGWLRGAAAGVALLWAGAAGAFTLETAFTSGCHEELTLSALERGGWPGGRTPPAATDLHRSLQQNLPFRTPEGADPWTLSLLIGVRQNDLHGAAPWRLPEMVKVHQQDALQAEHCLRQSGQDGPAGDGEALAQCRAFILSELKLALSSEGVGTTLAQVERVPLSLLFQEVSQEDGVEVSTYAYHLGRALHALQDSFTHSFRNPATGQVRHVFNYVDPAVASDFDAGRDGHAHLDLFDTCSGTRPEEQGRMQMATEASAALITALADTSGGPQEQLARAGSTLARSLGHEPGCTEENGWCGSAAALEDEQAEEAAGCQAAASGVLAPGAMLLARLLSRRRRPSRPVSRRDAPAMALGLVLGLVLLTPGPAGAEERGATRGPLRAAPTSGAPAALGAAAPAPAARDGAAVPPPATSRPRTLGLVVTASGSVDQGGLSVGLATRVGLSERLTLGLDAEWSPWMTPLYGAFSAGVANAYATAQWRWASLGGLELRSSLNLGTSVLLFEAYGARPGAVGLFAGGSLLQAAVRLSPDLWLEVRPELALSAPSLGGVPLVYRQYRLGLGLQWNL